MDKKDLLDYLDYHINHLKTLSGFIEVLKSAEPWFQSSVIQDWVAMKIAARYLKDGLIRLKNDI